MDARPARAQRVSSNATNVNIDWFTRVYCRTDCTCQFRLNANYARLRAGIPRANARKQATSARSDENGVRYADLHIEFPRDGTLTFD
ncbi:hypothetical protein BMD20_26215 [Burkholderia multivorans]|nr:hypothetical protein BMD20_26215 [Burkholderia multivorans]KHS15101.1 hypothetical protein BMD22_20450 [Burkholderia multivorans]